MSLFTSFTLPGGQTLTNRIAKAAMEENLANGHNLPDQPLYNLYQRWGHGGSGLIITGNVMIDPSAMTGPGGVVLTAASTLAPFQQWATHAKANGSKVWMQLNHPGRQVYANMGTDVVAPSAVPLDLGKHSKRFGQPRALTHAEIEQVIERFVNSAKQARAAGFDGVQIHAAHGYLLSQFLSPRVNQRDDQWGGSLANRARLLLHVVKAVRAAVPAPFALSVKLNSADFQRGGFDVDDAKQLLQWLNPLGLDLIELSGGSYEAPAMQGQSGDERTLAREAYFLEFAQTLLPLAQVPLMVTGGIRRAAVAQQVLDNGMALVGMASALAQQPQLPNLWQQQQQLEIAVPQARWKDNTLRGLGNMAIIKRQLSRHSQHKGALKQPSALWSLLLAQWRQSQLTKRYRRHQPKAK
ncbi:NADH:flavin oxidoreductase/NADH oxidase family protein [uncultured Ferrimonas sp.]|uniref:NADH:flavin oxidoreductase/NADH oxidase family protein n=1 Tax=uncultured Ferrimonas sp. TaxID=432640 RepID=UPI00262751CA|nr:NADH:flavin oxidoreductase/NADH oxidase family protein [uncultured Ferrimonas sp.]